MIGPVDSYQSIYVAACGRDFPNHELGRRHERDCPACAMVDHAACAVCETVKHVDQMLSPHGRTEELVCSEACAEAWLERIAEFNAGA